MERYIETCNKKKIDRNIQLKDRQKHTLERQIETYTGKIDRNIHWKDRQQHTMERQIVTYNGKKDRNIIQWKDRQKHTMEMYVELYNKKKIAIYNGKKIETYIGYIYRNILRKEIQKHFCPKILKGQPYVSIG